jgi:hypothetical protein
MMDHEVIRLRRLRASALRARAVAGALGTGKQIRLDAVTARDRVFARSAMTCWRIARCISGQLRAHPHLSYQSGPSRVSTLCDSLAAHLQSAITRRRRDRRRHCAEHLQRVARELIDTRALTLSPGLNDMLGRSQAELKLLIGELTGHQETGAAADSDLDQRVDAAVNWPYLAF